MCKPHSPVSSGRRSADPGKARIWWRKSLVFNRIHSELSWSEFDLVEGAFLSDLVVRHSHQAAPSRNYWD